MTSRDASPGTLSGKPVDASMTGVETAAEEAGRPLRLRAEDADDMAVAASCLQDALLPVSGMTYEARERRFVMVVQRFRWEAAGGAGAGAGAGAAVPADDAPGGERVHCGVRFDGVGGVRTHGLDRRQGERILNLLTVHPAGDHIDLAFADNVTIRLAVDRILCHIEDIGEPWPTVFTPSHPDSGAGGEGGVAGNSGLTEDAIGPDTVSEEQNR